MLKDISNIWLPEHELHVAFIYGAVYKVLSSFIRLLRKLSVLGTIHYLSRRVLGGGSFVGYHIVFCGNGVGYKSSPTTTVYRKDYTNH